MKKTFKTSVYLFLLICVCTSFLQAQNFNINNLAVLLADSNINNTTVRVLELDKNTASQSPVQSIQISGTGTAAIRVSGSATSTLYASNSKDGSLLCLTGFNSTTTTVNANTLNPRAVITINNSGSISIPTTYTGISGNQARAACTANNVDWYIGDQGGIYTNNTSTPSPSGNFRSVRAFGDSVYVFKASTLSAPVGTISAISGGTITDLPGLPLGASSRQDFYLISSGSNGNIFDVLYILDATSATVGTIFKFSLVAGSWVANGSHSTNFGGFSIAAEASGTGANLFVSSGTGATANNNLIKLFDAAGHNSNINITTANNVILFSATNNRIIKGIAFAPKLAVPVFTQLPTQCSGQLFNLPDTSNNGIVGSWSPAIDTANTTIYTFTPDSAQNAVTTTMTVTIIPTQTPIFTQVSPICQYGFLAPLPTTSNNGILGSWTPAINNIQTTTYTFVDSSGVCINDVQMTIVVNPLVEPSFTQVAAICVGASLSPLPTTSNDSISGYWLPQLDSSQTTTYVFIPDSIFCADTTSMTITVNQTTVVPTFTQLGPICSGDSIILPSTSNNNVVGNWSPTINNTQTTNYTFTPLPNQCASTASMTVTVNQPIVPNFPTLDTICFGDSINILTNSSNNLVTGVWSPNANNTQTTTYIFTPDSILCATEDTLTIFVNPLPVVNAGNDIVVCDSSLPVNITATASGNSINYLWNTGDTTATISVNTQGNYAITVTNIFNCSASDNVNLSIQTCSGIDYQNELLEIYPNPVQNTLFVNNQQFADSYFEITSIDGRILMRETLELGTNEIDFTNLNSGLYFLRIAGKNLYKIIKL